MKLLRSWFGTSACPIGIDLGSDTLKLAQCAPLKDGSRELIAAASIPLPHSCRRDPNARIKFFADNIRELIKRGGFRGRRAVLSLPASFMYLQRLRLPRMDEPQTRQMVMFESRGKLPIDPSAAMLRHVVAGEVYQEQEPLNEVIVMAAARELMDRFLAAAARAKINVVGMTAEPQATIDCFAHVLSGTPQAGVPRMFLDIGAAASRMYIARGPQLLFARVIPFGGEHLTQAVAGAMKIPVEEARKLRLQREQKPAASDGSEADAPPREGYFPLARRPKPQQGEGGGCATAVEPPHARATAIPSNPVDAACATLAARLIDELEMCLRYHESTFPTSPVEQIQFVGGEASARRLCQQIAATLGLPAQTGDPVSRLLRKGRTIRGLDTSRPQPAWTVAIGLSVGSFA